ncbi:MAG: hypothetical protein H7177_17880 [Rhizobacter sp.]|nr:hypothetical protein [Bacteriovorax sp.]
MKKMIVLIGIIMSVATFASAGEIVRTPMLDYTPLPGMDYVFDVKTTKFDKVTLDCQSFITGIDFYNSNELQGHVPLDMFSCEDLVTFLDDSKTNNEPVCIGLDAEEHQLFMSHDSVEECK